MKPFRFLHAADLHLDSPYKGLTGVPSSIRERIRESSFSALRRLVDIAVSQQVDFVLVSGDVYDLSDRSLRAQLKFQQAAEELSEHGIPLFVIHGNHDPLDGGRAGLKWPDTVHFFGGERVETVDAVDREGDLIARVSGISYLRASVTDNLAARFPKPADDGIYSIGLLHANVDGDEGHDNYAPCSKDQLIRSGYDYWALGHIHARRVLHTAPYIVYPGNIQGRSVKESGAKGCYVVDVDASGHATLTFQATEAVRWERRELTIQGLEDEQQMKNAIERCMTEVKAENPGIPVVMRLLLTGRGPMHGRIARTNLLQELIHELREEQAAIAESGGSQAEFVWIESCQAESGAEIPLDTLIAQDSFMGDLLRLSEELLSDDEALFRFYQEAVDSLLKNNKAAKLLSDIAPEQLRSWIKSAREQAIDELLGEEGRGA